MTTTKPLAASSLSTSTALAALLAFALGPACSSAPGAASEADDNRGESSTNAGGPGASTAASVISPYADPTCAGLTLDPWPRDAEGWTVLPSVKQPGRRVIYVSAANHGKASPDPASPEVYYVTTPAAGVALLRAGQPDSLLFARGETFHLSAWIDSHGLNGGATTADAKVIGAYGAGARPVLMWNQAQSIISVADYAAENLILTQLDIEPDPSLKVQGTGITLFKSPAHVLVEDVKINGFQKGMDIEYGTDVVVRRSEIVGSCGGYRSQGIYAQDMLGLTLDENTMDRNGLQVCGDPTSGSPQGQGVYVHSSNQCFRARGNVVARSLGNTLEARAGGDVVGNVFIGSSAALNYGLVLGGSIEEKSLAAGVYGKVTGNVFLDNQVGVSFGNTARALFSGNVMAATVPVEGAIYLDSQTGIGIHGLTISDNAVSAAQYFVSFQWGLPAGPVVLKNDGKNTQVESCDGTFQASDFSVGGVVVFKYESTLPAAKGKLPCRVGLEMNGADVYTDATPSVKVTDSSVTGILMKPGASPLTFTAPNALQGNRVAVTRAPFESGQTPLHVNPSQYLPEAGDDLVARFADPSASIADILGSEEAFYAAMAAQSHSAWNAKITAAAVIPHFQKAYAPKP